MNQDGEKLTDKITKDKRDTDSQLDHIKSMQYKILKILRKEEEEFKEV